MIKICDEFEPLLLKELRGAVFHVEALPRRIVEDGL